VLKEPETTTAFETLKLLLVLPADISGVATIFVRELPGVLVEGSPGTPMRPGAVLVLTLGTVFVLVFPKTGVAGVGIGGRVIADVPVDAEGVLTVPVKALLLLVIVVTLPLSGKLITPSVLVSVVPEVVGEGGLSVPVKALLLLVMVMTLPLSGKLITPTVFVSVVPEVFAFAAVPVSVLLGEVALVELVVVSVKCEPDALPGAMLGSIN
jgi:hypothetical protein